ncbi:14022_t:CDS:2 [Entrophospora sp. SA101]
MSAPKQEVLVLGELKHQHKLLEEMKTRYEFKEFKSTRKDFVVEATSKYENVTAILLAHGAQEIINKFDTEVLDSLSPAINVILVIGNASELVDVKVATGNGVFVADTSGKLNLSEEEIEHAALDNLDFALITGVPKDPVNEIEEVKENAAEKAIELIEKLGSLSTDELDVSDLTIKL